MGERGQHSRSSGVGWGICSLSPLTMMKSVSGETGEWERMTMLYRCYRNGLGEEGAGNTVFPCHSINDALLEVGSVFKHKSETCGLIHETSHPLSGTNFGGIRATLLFVGFVPTTVAPRDAVARIGSGDPVPYGSRFPAGNPVCCNRTDTYGVDPIITLHIVQFYLF